MINPAQPPEGILDPQQPWWPADRVGPQIWLRLKGKLTGRPIAEMSGERHTSYVKLGDADADRLIENIKKYGKYPQVNQNDKYGGAYNAEAYQKWLVEEFLEKPFRQEVDEKIDARTQTVLKRVFPEAQQEVNVAETKQEVVAVLDDKVELLEAIREDINPPRSEYQIPDPWEGSYTTGKKSPRLQPTLKKTKKVGRPKGTIKKTRKKKSTAESTKNNQPPESRRSRAVKMVGGGILKAAKNFGRTLLSSSASGAGGTAFYGSTAGGGSTPSGAGDGPSLFGIGSWLGKKVFNAFQDAKVEKARALEAQSNGAEVPAEMLEPGYFLRKSIGYQFGGRAFDTTFGAFIENMPSKQSSKKAGFGDQFDYGDSDPKKKKNKKDLPSELASGFRSVNKSLTGINNKLTENISILQKLVGETTRVGDLLEQVLGALGGVADVESNDEIQQAVQQQNAESGLGDIKINIDGEDGGLNFLDLLDGADDIFDILRRRKKKTGLGKQNKLYRNMRQRGMPSLAGPKPPRAPRVRGGRLGGLMNLTQLINFSEGGMPGQPVRALVGEAGPELVVRSGATSTASPGKATTKLAEGGAAGGGLLPSAGIGYKGIKGGEAMGFAQPLATAMDLIMKVSGARVLASMGGFLRSVGPLAGVFSTMLSPFVNPIATIFGLNQTAAAAELTQGIPSEQQGIKQLAKLFSNVFSVLGIFTGGGGKKKKKKKPQTTATGDWAPLLDVIGAGEGGYTSVNPGQKIDNLTEMTISDAWGAAKALGESKGGTGAMGRYQLLSDPVGRARDAGLDPTTDKFTPENQDKIASYIIENIRGGNDWKEGKISDEDFGQRLANEWAGIQGPSGKGSYDGDGQNAAHVKWDKVKEALGKIKGTGAYRGMAKSFSSNSGPLEGMFEISGPDTGYRVPEDLTHGDKIVGHGVEWLMKFKRSFVILPVENRKYSITRDPKKTLERWGEISNDAGLTSDGKKWRPAEMFKSGSEQSSVNDTMQNVYKLFSTPDSAPANTPAKPAAEMPVGNVSPVDFSAGVNPSGVAVMNNTIIAQEKVPVYIPVPVPGPTEYVHANIYESARTMRFMEFVKKLT